MMGGGYFEYLFPYDVYDYSRAPPAQGGYRRPREPELSQRYRNSEPGYSSYGSNLRQPTGTSRNLEENQAGRARKSARNMFEAPTVKNVITIPVEDGGARLENQGQKTSNVVPTRTATRFGDVHLAATKIQSVYRGYVVRKTEPIKHLRVIGKVKSELREFTRKSDEPGQHQKLCTDPQERLRWIEGVMALLLRLDSLQGAHPVVRDVRKSVSREVIQFQEKIDSMSDAEVREVDEGNNNSAEEINAIEMEDVEGAHAKDVVHENLPVARGGDVAEDMGIEPEGATLGKVRPEIGSQHEGTMDNSDIKIVSADDESVNQEVQVVELGDAGNDSFQATERDESTTSEQQMSQVLPSSAGVEKLEERISTSAALVDGGVDSYDLGLVSMVEEAPGGLPDTSAAETLRSEPSTHEPEGVAMDGVDECPTLMEMPAKEAMAMEGISTEGRPATELEDGRVANASTDIQENEATPAPTQSCDRDNVTGPTVPWTPLLSELGSHGPLQMSLTTDCTTGADHPSSNRALLQQILEENMKLKAVVGKVLQWGQQQNDIIHNLASRVEQLEGKLLDADSLLSSHVGRKRIGFNVGPGGERGRATRRLEKGGRKSKSANHRQIGYFGADDYWFYSPESEEYF